MIPIVRCIVLCFIVMVALTGVVRAESTEQEVSRAEDARYDIMIRNDQVAFDAILADEFVYHQPSGAIVPKAQYMGINSIAKGLGRHQARARPAGAPATRSGPAAWTISPLRRVPAARTTSGRATSRFPQ